jgi:hypothetical protein
MIDRILLAKHLLISNPLASELILPIVRTRQCRVPTINRGRDTALPCPLYHSGATGIDMTGGDKRPRSAKTLTIPTI